jgi:hypothetical protein
VRRYTKIKGHLLSGLMVQTAFEAFTLGRGQAQDRCPRVFVYHVNSHAA